MKLICPACGAELQFKSRVSVFGVCSYCSSMIVRHDLDLENLGKMATLPPDMSPLQIGTRGCYLSRKFELVGRLKIAWEQGTWNEWYAVFENGEDGWLADAQGLCMVSTQIRDISKVPDQSTISPGSEFALIDSIVFEVDDIKNVICVASEGELPFFAKNGRKSLSVDLSGPDGQFASLDYATDETRLFLGRYTDLNELQLTGLREIDGW